MKKFIISGSKRFLSGLLATTLTLSMLPTTSAVEENSELEYYLSLDANSDEYQAWKSTFSVNDTGGEISTYALRSSSNSVSNEYLEITLNGSNFTLGTVEGNPDSASDNNKTLLFGYPTGGTSYTTIQIDGVNTIFTPETTTYRENSIISTDVIDDIIVTQYLNIIDNQYTGQDDVAEFFYTVENTGSDNHNVGVRIMFDTMLGNNDSAPFRLPNVGNVTTETDLRGSSVPEFWQAFDSLTSPSVIAQGTLNIDKDSTPDRVRFTNWGMASRNKWDYTRTAGSSNGDSAVCLYWNPKSIGTNQTLSCKTYYGLSSLQQDNAPPLAVAISGATKLEVEEDENGVKSYSPNPFTVTAYIQNIGTGTAYNANIELTLPDGMSVVNGTNIVSLGDIPVSSTQQQVSWNVNVEPSAVDKIETYGIIVTADNAETKVLERQLEIPALVDNSVELWLDRSIITDNNNLNLNFKIVNTSNTPIALNQLLAHYYYIDESPRAEKQFNCYSVYTNEPYSYLPNTAVTLTNHQLESLHDDATHYYEISFDSDKELLPNQEIIVNSSINNTSWSKIVSSNDYSAVGDDTLASGSYMLWKYMPVFISSDMSEPIWGTMPEIDTDGMEPDLLVELDPNAVNGKGYMNLNIRITNNGILPIDLSQTEIKYYYTNDRGRDQSVAGNYIGGRIDNNFVGITDKVIIDAVKMDVRKKMADTYVSIKFAEDTGTLNFEDYIDLNVQVYNTDWKSGDYILENDHSFQEEKQEIQTFSLRVRAASNTTGMRTANNIVVCSMYMPFFPPVSTEVVESSFVSGIEPIESYEPTFSAFKIGQGKTSESGGNSRKDYDNFIKMMSSLYNGKEYSKFATLYNTDTQINFTEDNIKAALESDIVYISSHGFDGGVIPIYSSSTVNLKGYDKIITTDKNIGNDFHTYEGPTIEKENAFSVNMKDYQDADINENLKWMILSACSQLSDSKKYSSKSSLQRWVNVLENNQNLKGVIGYHGAAPDSKAFINDVADYKVINDFLVLAKTNSIYYSWIQANAYNYPSFNGQVYDTRECALLVKDNYELDNMYESLSDGKDVTCSNIFLYTFSYNDDNKVILNPYIGDSVANLARTNEVEINMSQEPLVFTIKRDKYDHNGVFQGSEQVEEILMYRLNDEPLQTFSLNNYNLSEAQYILFRHNVQTNEVSMFGEEE